MIYIYEITFLIICHLKMYISSLFSIIYITRTEKENICLLLSTMDKKERVANLSDLYYFSFFVGLGFSYVNYTAPKI